MESVGEVDDLFRGYKAIGASVLGTPEILTAEKSHRNFYLAAQRWWRSEISAWHTVDRL